MSRILPLLLGLLAGCGAHTGVSVGPGSSGAAPSASASVGIHAGPAVGTLIGLGFMAAIIRSDADYAERAAPELDPTRRVQEQDCSQPIEDWSANLRCR